MSKSSRRPSFGYVDVAGGDWDENHLEMFMSLTEKQNINMKTSKPNNYIDDLGWGRITSGRPDQMGGI